MTVDPAAAAAAGAVVGRGGAVGIRCNPAADCWQLRRRQRSVQGMQGTADGQWSARGWGPGWGLPLAGALYVSALQVAPLQASLP